MFVMGMSCMNYLIHAMLLSNKKSWGWRSKMSEFMVVCFYVYTRRRIPFSISMSIVPPKAIGAIILSFIIAEAPTYFAVPILEQWEHTYKYVPSCMSEIITAHRVLQPICHRVQISTVIWDEPGPICCFFVAVILSRSQLGALQFLLDMPQIK